MAFTREDDVTKDSIKDFEIVFYVPEIITAEIPQTGTLNVQIGLSDGTIDLVQGIDLLARLQDDAAGLIHLANLVSLRNYIRTRLENELLPL